MEKGKKTLKMPLNTELFGEKKEKKKGEKAGHNGGLRGRGYGSAPCGNMHKKENTKRISEGAGGTKEGGEKQIMGDKTGYLQKELEGCVHMLYERLRELNM